MNRLLKALLGVSAVLCVAISANAATPWSLQTTGTGWQFVNGAATPSTLCKTTALSKTDVSDLQSAGTASMVEVKYGADLCNWPSSQVVCEWYQLTSHGGRSAGLHGEPEW